MAVDFPRWMAENRSASKPQAGAAYFSRAACDAMRCDAMRQEKLHDDGIERPEMAMMGDW